MKSTRTTLLSALILLGSFVPIKASSDDEASAHLMEALTSQPAGTVVANIAKNCFSGYSNTTVGLVLFALSATGTALGCGAYWLMGSHEVALKAQEGKNDTLKLETTHKLNTQRDATLAQHEALIQDAHNFVAKLKQSPNDTDDTDFMQKVIVSNNQPNRVRGFYDACELHKENLAKVYESTLKDEAQDVRKLINLYRDKAQAIVDLRILEDEEEKNAELLTQMRLDNSIRKRYEEQLSLMIENIKKNDERNAETHKVFRTAMQEVDKEVKTISITINDIHKWQQLNAKQLDRYVPSIVAASQICANLKDALNNVATQEQLTHGMAGLAKALQENQKSQGAQLSMHNNKLDAQRSKLDELDEKINALEQKLAKLNASHTTQASMSNPHNWDAHKNTPAKKIDNFDAITRPEEFSDPRDEIRD